MNYAISNPQQKLQISTNGAQVLSWQIYNPNTGTFQNILYQGSTAKRSGIPILFPFANPLAKDIFEYSGKIIPQHGFARNIIWHFDQTQSKNDSITLFSTNQDLDIAMQLAYPFEFKLELYVQLRAENTLSYTLKITNLGQSEMPVAPGFHPYFDIQHKQKNQIIIPEISEFQTGNFDWDIRQTDGTFFKNPGTVEICFPDKVVQLNTSESEINFEYLVVWSQNLDQADHDFICIEPFSRYTNAINTNPVKVQPHSKLDLNLEFKVNFKV